MPTILICPGCASPIKVADNVPVDLLRCPNCDNFLKADAKQAEVVRFADFANVAFDETVNRATWEGQRPEDREKIKEKIGRPRPRVAPQPMEKKSPALLIACTAVGILVLIGGLVLLIKTSGRDNSSKPTNSDRKDLALIPGEATNRNPPVDPFPHRPVVIHPKVEIPPRPVQRPEVVETTVAGIYANLEIAPGPKVYLSDLTETASRTGLWPVGKNGRFGNPASAWSEVNHPIRVGGKECSKGIGMVPNDGSRTTPGITYSQFKLGKLGLRFQTSVALDDSVRHALSDVVFEVRGDGKVLWTSPGLRQPNRPIVCDVDVAGVDLFELRVRIDGSSHDAQAVWCDPVVIKKDDGASLAKSGPPKVEISPMGDKDFVYCSDLPGLNIKSSVWPVTFNGRLGNKGSDLQPENAELVVQGERAPKGISMLPLREGETSVQFNLSGKGRLFSSRVGINDTGRFPRGEGWFSVLGDGKRLWKSEPLKRRGDIQTCSVDVSGVTMLELRTSATGPHFDQHCVWLDPRVYLIKEAEVAKKDPPQLVTLDLGDDVFVHCSDMQGLNIRGGPWPVTFGGRLGNRGGSIQPENAEIIVKGEKCPGGISMMPPRTENASVQFKLAGQAKQFVSRVALNDTAGQPRGEAVFIVLGDGKQLWKSEPVTRAEQVQSCQVDASGIQLLELRTIATGSNLDLHCVWLDPRVRTDKSYASSLRKSPASKSTP